MLVCPICGITREEQEAQQELASIEGRKLYARWKQRNDPNEPAPGLPVTNEYRVHYALLLYQNDSSMDPTVVAIARAAREARVDYKVVVRALDHTNRTSAHGPWNGPHYS